MSFTHFPAMCKQDMSLKTSYKGFTGKRKIFRVAKGYLACCMDGGGGICACFCSLLEATTSIFAGWPSAFADETA